MDIRGQHVVVIGGTSGIGFAVARRALEAGAEVTVASSRRTSVDAALKRLGEGARGQVVNVLDTAEVEAFFDAIGPVDHLVHTAGEPLSMMKLADLDLDRARSFFEIRYFGALNAAHAVGPHLRAGGSITLTSGTAGERSGAGWALGASVCGAINSLTRALAVELAPVRVNAVAPGITRSPVWAEMDEAGQEAMYEQVGKALPLGRVGEVEDAADAYVYCLGQPYTTGTVLTVDGGTLVA
jgi:NAD(P)-dependent dehydrogenase (short-subunit alcohol dehydrogenase family)